MKNIYYSGKAKKDLKKYRNNEKLMKALLKVLGYLANGQDVPSEYRPHKLTGNYKGCMECHVGNDFLLIWIDPDNETIEVVRIGSHSELFK